jgi:hypothetical protein
MALASRPGWLIFALAFAAGWFVFQACGGKVAGDGAQNPPGPEPWPADASVQPTGDAGPQATDAPSDKPPFHPAKFPDAGKKDGGASSWVIVDGGKDCNLPPFAGWDVIRTCCNGMLCQGWCVLVGDATAPECNCAGITGGCPSPHVCCGNNCTSLDICASSEP